MILGQQGGLRIAAAKSYPSVEEIDVRSMYFFAQPPRPAADQVDSADDDAAAKQEFKTVEARTSVELEQREPLLKMVVKGDGPVLVGEWFELVVALDNKENKEATEVRSR